MKILICGKGGGGKSVIAAIIAKELTKRGKRVLLIDADESNSIDRILGVHESRELIDFLGGKEEVRKRLFSFIKSEKRGELFSSLNIDEIPKEFVVEKDGVKVLKVGKLQEFNEGCACPMGAVTREFLGALRLKENDFAVVDTEAGLEHFGRGIEANCDVIVAIAEPNYDSIKLVEKIRALSDEIGKRVVVVGNKFNQNYRALIKADVFVPFRKEIFEACLFGKEVPIIKEAEEIVDKILLKG